MGTRCLTILKEKTGDEIEEIAVLYRNFDGYPSAHGQEIVSCFQGKKVVNGFNGNDQINGAGDMAIQLIAYLKSLATTAEKTPINSPGNFRLFPAGERGGVDFVYTITCINPSWPNTGELRISCDGGSPWNSFSEGTFDEFAAWIEQAPWERDHFDDED